MAYDIGPFEGGGGLGARRLLALAAYLETLRDQDYDHRTWRRRGVDGAWTMCALGHGVTALPDVIGLRWREPDSADVVRMDGSGITQNALNLAAEAFELSLDEAATIFGMGLYTVGFYGLSGVVSATGKVAHRRKSIVGPCWPRRRDGGANRIRQCHDGGSAIPPRRS
jgi:hypothetical protein